MTGPATHLQALLAAPGLTLTHLQTMVFFALVVSVTFGFLSRRAAYHRARYILWSFFLFLAIGIGIGWLMYPFSR
jgi:hypothetical protein